MGPIKWVKSRLKRRRVRKQNEELFGAKHVLRPATLLRRQLEVDEEFYQHVGGAAAGDARAYYLYGVTIPSPFRERRGACFVGE
jgi:hypothetical protein